jgi:DNA repair protein RecN (Recombination protein N)
MLRTLDIKNAGLVDQLSIEFEPGLCAITGETGAGKSMLIGSIELILGERAGAKLVRSGEDCAVIGAVFDVGGIGGVGELLERFGIQAEDDGTLLITRQVSAGGKSRCYINGRPATVSMLKELGDRLVDIHSQNQHQSLLRQSSHLDLLDAFASVGGDRAGYAEIFSEFQKRKTAYEEFIAGEQEQAQQIDLYHFQVNEIKSANPAIGEEEELKQERDLMRNSEEIAGSISQILTALDSDDDSAASALRNALGQLGGLGRINPVFDEEYQKLNEAVIGIDDVVAKLGHYAEKLEFDPGRMEQIEQRLHTLFQLKKKYGASVEEILEHLAMTEQKLGRFENRDHEIERLKSELEQVRKKVMRLAKKLTKARREAALQLGGKIENELKQLGIDHCRFEVRTDNSQLSPTGMDSVTFMISPNLGEPLKPLKEIASGGEVSRVMLAIKSVLAEKDTIPILIFDEIDVNIGGKTAVVVGKKLRELASTHQVLCITHLPQVAAEGGSHFVVTKSVNDGRSVTSIDKLDKKKRVQEITRMLGGDRTKISTQYAEKILKY